MTTTTVEEMILQTDASGAPVRLEYVRGRLKVEASPAMRHQKTVGRIERSMRAMPGAPGGCACYPVADVLIRFPDPDASLKRPDLAIFCTEPPDTDEATDVLPAAIIEILSLGYEEKDLGPDGAPFYLDYVPEVLVVDPRAQVVYHYRAGRHERAQYPSPITLTLQCGCQVTL
jgi:Uma2 family endonuclease